MHELAPSRVLVPLGLAVCLSLFGDLTLYAVLVTQLDVVGLSLGAAGIMLGANRLIRIPGNPLAGALFDRWGRRRLFILGMLLGVLSTASYALVRGFWPFLLGRLAWGIAWTLINVGGLAMVLDISTKANRGRLTGIYNTWVLIGLALGPLVGGFLVDAVGFRLALLTCAGIVVVGLAIAVAALPETGRLTRKERGQGSQPTPGVPARPRQIWRQRARILLSDDHGLVTAAWLYLITMFAGDGVVLSTTSLLLQRRFGEALSVGNLAVGVASAAGILLGLRYLLASAVGPMAGHLSDRLRPAVRHPHPAHGGAHPGLRSGRWLVISASLVLGMVGFAVLSLATSLGSVVVGVLLGAVSGAATVATLTAQVGDLTPPGREGAAMGALATAGDVGSMAGPFLAFALLSVTDLKWVYLLCAGTFLMGLWLVWRGARRQQRR